MQLKSSPLEARVALLGTVLHVEVAVSQYVPAVFKHVVRSWTQEPFDHFSFVSVHVHNVAVPPVDVAPLPHDVQDVPL